MKKFSLTFLVSIFIASNADFISDEHQNIYDRKIWSQCHPPGNCSCGVQLGKTVICSPNDNRLLIQPCYCLYYDPKRNTTIAGPCLFTCFYPQNRALDLSYSIERYHVQNYSQFNEDMCNSKVTLNRRDRFCGRCKPDFGFPVYSYNIACIPCKNTSYKNWLKYLAIALGPLTAFYIIMATFRASMITSHLNGMLFVIQCITSPTQVRMLHTWALKTSQQHKLTLVYLKIIYSILGLANLDFFRDFYPKFCLNPTYTMLEVISLDLLVAVYPFVLILSTYLLISLYYRNCRPIVFVWQHCKRLLNPILKKSVHVSLTETFATFTLLSSVKVIGLSYDLLIYTRAYQENGSYGGIYTFYDPSVVYFSKEHRLPALLAIISSFALALLPFLLLLLYPSRCFQNLLNYFNIRSHALHIFMDAFQGSYKTEPHDLRYFAAWYLLLRFLFLLFFGLFHSILSMTTASVIMILGALSVAILKPYKNNHNTRDILLLLSAALFYLSMATNVGASFMDYKHLAFAQCLMILSAAFIVMVTSATMFWNPITKTVRALYNRARHKFGKKDLLVNETTASNSYETCTGN